MRTFISYFFILLSLFFPRSPQRARRSWERVLNIQWRSHSMVQRWRRKITIKTKWMRENSTTARKLKGGLRFNPHSFWRCATLSLLSFSLLVAAPASMAACKQYLPDSAFLPKAYTNEEVWNGTFFNKNDPSTIYPIASTSHYTRDVLSPLAVSWIGLSVKDIFQECDGHFVSASSSKIVPPSQNNYFTQTFTAQAANGVLTIRNQSTATRPPQGYYIGYTVTSYLSTYSEETTYIIKTGEFSVTGVGGQNVFSYSPPDVNGNVFASHGTSVVSGGTSGIWPLVTGVVFQEISPITFTPTTMTVGGSTTANAVATSLLEVSFSSLTPSVCSISGRSVTGISAGTCIIAANQAGDSTYRKATQVTGSINVGKTPDSKDPKNDPKSDSQAVGTDTNATGVCPDPSSTSKDPVDLATGYFFDTLKLMEVATPGAPLQMNLSYSSGKPVVGSTGFGWGHPYQYSLNWRESNSLGWDHFYGFLIRSYLVNVTWPDRHISTYQGIQDHSGLRYTNSSAHASDTLVQDQDGYILTDRRQKTYNFDVYGKLVSTVDRLGFTRNFSYLANGNLDKVTDALSGRFMQFGYDAQNRITSVTSAGVGTVTLVYDVSGNLVSVTDALGKTTNFTYDANHHLLSKINALGSITVTNTYDIAGRVTSQDDGLTTSPLEQFTYASDGGLGNRHTDYRNRSGGTTRQNFDAGFNLLGTVDPLGGIETHSYAPSGVRTSYIDPLNNQTQFTYDDSGYVLTRTDALGQVASYTYDASHNISRITDEAGKVTTMTYDANHRLLTQTDPAGKTKTYTYNAQGLPATFTTPNGGVTRFAYDVKGQLTTLTDPVGLVTSFTYDAAGRVLTTTDSAGKVWTKTYDLMGHVLTATDPLGNTTSYTYDALGRITTKTAPGGGITQYAYDIHDNLTSITNPIGAVTRFAYDADDQLISTTDALGRLTSVTRDAKGRLTSTTNALGNVNTLGYDVVDNVITTKDALNNVTTLAYDKLHRLTSITDPLSNSNAASFNALSRVVSNTDGKAGVTSFAYDALSRLISTTNARGGVAAQTFDANGNRLSFTDTLGNKTAFTYDAANRITRVVTADGGVINYTYNTQNRVATATNGRGQVATYTYNAAGWPVSMTDPSVTISMTYDANGNVLTVTDAVGTSTNTYDAANRITSHTDVFGRVMAYGYDAVGNLTTLTYPGNKVVTYTYNAANRMTSVKDWANRLTSYTYNARGNITAITRANGTSGAYTYDAKGQLASLAETFPTGTSSYGIAYTYDANGNITSEVNTPPRTAPTLVANTMTYGADNRLTTLNGQATTFDADGNMTSGRLNGAASTFTYDARSYLTGVGSSSYVYDAQGNRVSATNAGVTTRYVVDPNAPLSRMLMETTATGTPVAYYVYGATGLISRESATGAYQTYHYDLRGSTVKLASATGTVTDSYGYGPFGELVSSTGTTTNPFKYNGRDGVMTEANGLYYMRARYYSPEAKRFVNRDVLLGSIDRALTLNRFAYVNGNPVGFADPGGMAGIGTAYGLVTVGVKQTVKDEIKGEVTEVVTKRTLDPFGIAGDNLDVVVDVVVAVITETNPVILALEQIFSSTDMGNAELPPDEMLKQQEFNRKKKQSICPTIYKPSFAPF